MSRLIYLSSLADPLEQPIYFVELDLVSDARSSLSNRQARLWAKDKDNGGEEKVNAKEKGQHDNHQYENMVCSREQVTALQEWNSCRKVHEEKRARGE